MAKVSFQSVDQYIATHPAPMQRLLQRVRTVIRQTLPNAVEGIAYQIPAYKIDGANAIFFAGWKSHISLYPIGELVAATLGKELARYELSKGTIKLPLDESLPVHLIARIARLRGEETVARLQRKAADKKTTRTPASAVKRAPKKAAKPALKKAAKPAPKTGAKPAPKKGAKPAPKKTARGRARSSR